MEYEEFQRYIAMRDRIQELEAENEELRNDLRAKRIALHELGNEHKNLRVAYEESENEVTRLLDLIQGV